MQLPVGCSDWSRIRFRVHLARGQVGKGIGPCLDVPLILTSGSRIT